MKPLIYLMASASLLLAGCGGGDGTSNGDGDSADPVEINRNPFPSTYTPYPSTTTLIKDATVLDGIGGELVGGDVLLVDGKVSEVAEEIAAPDGATVINANGKWQMAMAMEMASPGDAMIRRHCVRHLRCGNAGFGRPTVRLEK